VFQGVLLPKLRVIMGAWGGVVMTTAIFTLSHYGVFYASYPDAYPQGAMIWYGIAYPLVFGLTFSLLKVYAQSTRAVILGRVGAGMTLLLTALILVS
jgi:membrane protease YdiL (CAAX protease family)